MSTVPVKKTRPADEAKLDQLLPHIRPLAVQLIDTLTTQHGMTMAIGRTGTTPKQQAGLIAAGKSATIHSWHLLGRAIDLYPVVEGKLAGEKDEGLYRLMHIEAYKLGWEGIAYALDGSWNKRYIKTVTGVIWDAPHLQIRDHLTWSQAKMAQDDKEA